MEREVRLKEIFEVEKRRSFTLPDEYINFLIKNKGYSDGELIIYDISELEETNEYMCISEYAKEYIAIGDNGSGCVFLMKQERKTKEVLIVDMGDLNVSDPYQIIDDFSRWHKSNYLINMEDSEERKFLSELVDIILIELPEEKLKGILKIKKELELQYSAKEILEMTKNLPVVLKTKITRFGAQKLISLTGYEQLFELRKSV